MSDEARLQILANFLRNIGQPRSTNTPVLDVKNALARYHEAQLPVPGLLSPAATMGSVELVGSGLLAGMRRNVDEWRNALGYLSTADLNERQRLDKPLANTALGGIGYMQGQAFPLPPLNYWWPAKYGAE